jgi:hypothetical protein
VSNNVKYDISSKYFVQKELLEKGDRCRGKTEEKKDETNGALERTYSKTIPRSCCGV